MLKYKDLKLTAKSSYTNAKGQSAEMITPISGYLWLHNAVIINAEELSTEDIERKPYSSGDFSLYINRANSSEKYIGHAALVSSDGYFIIAAHVIDLKEGVLSFDLLNFENVLEREETITPITTSAGGERLRSLPGTPG